MRARTEWTKVAALAMSGLLTTSLGACAVGTDGDYVLHYTTYSGAESDQSKTVQRWVEEVERRTDGGVRFEMHYAQSLVDADEAARATLDGRADIAQVGSIYAASDLSMFTVVELPFETDNPEVQMRAIERLYAENEEFRGDFERQGLELLFPLPLGIALVGLDEPADSVDDLRGRSIRSGGLSSTALLEIGANPVAMTATDIYESMTRGVVSGYTSLALGNLSTFGLSRTTPHVVDPGIGAYASSIVVVNSELVDAMPEEYQRVLREASGSAIDHGLEEMGAAAEQACRDLIETDATFTSLPDEEVEQWKDAADIADGWVEQYEERGYDAQSVLDDYRRIIAEEEQRSTYEAELLQCMQEAR